MVELFDLDSPEYWHEMEDFCLEFIGDVVFFGADDYSGEAARLSLESYMRHVRRRKSALARKAKQPRMPLPDGLEDEGFEVRMYGALTREADAPVLCRFDVETGMVSQFRVPSCPACGKTADGWVSRSNIFLCADCKNWFDAKGGKIDGQVV